MTGKAWLACVLCTLALGPSLTGQVVVRPEAFVAVESPAQDAAAARGRGRSIPIGTSAITGVVTDARTGLPVAGARVGVSGPADPVATRASLSPATQPARSLSRAAMTDDNGRFAFDALPAGEFTVTVNRAGYLPFTYGAAKPDRPGTPIRFDAGQRVDTSITLLRGGVVAGVVTGPNGLPEFQAQVRALRLTMSTGVRRFLPMGSVMTDDRGVYRIFNLRPGEYVIAVTPRSTELTAGARIAADNALFEEALARARQGSGGLPPAVLVAPAPATAGSEPAGYASVYYPGTAQLSNAVIVNVDADTERLGVDVVAQPVRAGHVSGTVVGIPPGPVNVTATHEDGSIRTTTTRGQISVYGDGDARELGQIAGTSVDQMGRFVIRNLAPGRYTILAQVGQALTSVQRPTFETGSAGTGGPRLPPVPPPSMPVLWGRAAVEVDGQTVPEVTLTLQPGRTISGRVVYEGASLSGLSRPPVQVTATAALDAPQGFIGRAPQGQTEPDGRFMLTGVVPGRYTLRASGSVKSAIVNGADSLDFPFTVEEDRDIANVVITMSDQLAELSGTVMRPSGTPASDYTVVIAPSDSRYWLPGSRRVQASRPTSAGRFVFRGLPAGEYLLAAVTDVEPGGHYDPAFLKAMTAAAVRVSIADGGRHVQDIRSRPLP